MIVSQSTNDDMPNVYTLARVESPPYAVQGSPMQWLFCISDASGSLVRLVDQIGRLVAPQPCAVLLRVYGEAPGRSHVVPLQRASDAVEMLDRCEAVGICQCNDVSQVRQSFLEQLGDRRCPDDDEACLIRAVEPRAVVFIHAGHNSADLVCTQEDADRLMASLTEW